MRLAYLLLVALLLSENCFAQKAFRTTHAPTINSNILNVLNCDTPGIILTHGQVAIINFNVFVEEYDEYEYSPMCINIGLVLGSDTLVMISDILSHAHPGIDTTVDVYIGESPGDYHLSLLNLPPCADSSSILADREVSVVESTGIPAIEKKNEIIVYPNPAYSDIIVDLRKVGSSVKRIFITDVDGRVINIAKLDYRDTEFRIPTKELGAGQYFLHVATEEKTLIKEFVVQ